MGNTLAFWNTDREHCPFPGNRRDARSTMSMQYRTPARLGRPLSVIGQGCWQIGADWGEVTDDSAHAVLGAALDAGVTFFDTADVYGDGRSEQLVGAMRTRAAEGGGEAPFVATKASRRADPFAPESFTEENLRAWVERSRQNLAMDTLDLVQLHCPPSIATTGCSTCSMHSLRRRRSPPGASAWRPARRR
ncbi:MAG: aldo/keto reductase [Brachybacterium sp.]